jgi:hypothetical protein
MVPSFCYRGASVVITSKFQELLDSALIESQNKSQDAEYDRCRTLITYLLIQIVKDAHDLYRGNITDFQNTSNPSLLCAKEGRALEDWVKTHERFPFYCSVLGLPFEQIRTFVLEVGAGQHEMEVHRILKGLQANKDKPKPRAVKVGAS